MRPPLLVVTDLDGTLLDPATYRFTAAKPALRALRRLGIPLILCTSKTCAEVVALRRRLGNRDPFITENGGGIFIPRGYFPKQPPGSRPAGPWWVIRLGLPYARIRRALRDMQPRLPCRVQGFGDLSIRAVARLTGLSRHAAGLARQRHFDEPLVLEGNGRCLKLLKREAARRGLTVTAGGRLVHLTGENDKGKALRVLLRLFRDAWGVRPRTVGLGDGPNDLPFLKVVDLPVLVQRPDGTHDPRIRLAGLVRAPGVGPHGWNAALLELLEG